MGTAAGGLIPPEVRRLKKSGDDRAAERLEELRALLATTDYTNLNNKLQDTYARLTTEYTGHKKSSGVPVTKKLEDICNLALAIISFLENEYSVGSTFQIPQNIAPAHLILLCLDVLHNIYLVMELKGQRTLPKIDQTEVDQIATEHHLACLGYTDVILQGINKRTGKNIQGPRGSGSDLLCFEDYVDCINSALPNPVP